MANYYLPLDDDYWIGIKEAVNNALCWLNYIKIGFIKPLLKSYDIYNTAEVITNNNFGFCERGRETGSSVSSSV